MTPLETLGAQLILNQLSQFSENNLKQIDVLKKRFGVDVLNSVLGDKLTALESAFNALILPKPAPATPPPTN